MRLTYSIAAMLCVGGIVIAVPFTHSPSPLNPARQANGFLTRSKNATKEDARAPFSPHDPTNARFNIRRGNPGGCYMCALPGWSGECRYVVPMMGSCYSFEDWDFWPDGFGPDMGATCFMHSDYDCTSHDALPVTYPGYDNLYEIGWHGRLRSFSCTFQYRPQSAGDIQDGETDDGE